MKKRFLRLFALLLCLALLCALCVSAFADWGDFAGDNDYGGDWGGDDDWGGGGGGGWNWGGNDNDYDYGWSSSDSSYRGGGNVSPGVFIAIVVVGIVIMIIRVVAAGSDGSESGGSSYEDSYEYRNNVDNEDFNPSRAHTASRSDLPEEYRDLKDMDRYANIDPDFSASKLKQKLSNLYIQMQQCWQDKDIESMRPYFTDAYFSQLDRQLDAYRRKGITNYVERPAVLSVSLDGFCQEEGEDHIYATVKTRIVDYKLDDATGKLVSGSKTKEKFMTYRYHLTRPTGQRSDSESGVRSVSCPHCGAPLSINESAKCPYCGSVVTADAHEFVIAQIEGVAQRTV